MYYLGIMLHFPNKIALNVISVHHGIPTHWSHQIEGANNKEIKYY